MKISPKLKASHSVVYLASGSVFGSYVAKVDPRLIVQHLKNEPFQRQHFHHALYARFIYGFDGKPKETGHLIK